MIARSVLKGPSPVSVQSSAEDPERRFYTVRECGVDWLTATAFERGGGIRLQELGSRLLAAESRCGVDVRQWQFEQFSGLNGGQIAVGQGDGMIIVRLSSALAFQHWRKVYRLCDSLSRIDFQVTIEGVCDGPSFIRDRHEEAKGHVAAWKLKPEVLIRDSNRTGPTLYLGTRKSAWMGRVYDKFVESKLEDYAGCIRFELQFNKRLAKTVAHELSSNSFEGATGLAIINEKLSRRGIRRPWADGATLPVGSPRKRGTDDDRLRWLQSQVAPAISRLVAAGKLQEVLESLELDHLVQRTNDPWGS